MTPTCPQCGAALRPVSALANTGYLIALDQCLQCGGIWCDRWEVYPLTTAAAQQLDRVDQEALLRPTAAPSEQLACPRCHARMRRFRDPAVTADARIERCPNCEGMWFNRGELRRFKQHAPSSAANPTAASLATDAEIERLSQELGRAISPPPTVQNLSGAFDAAEDVAPTSDLRDELARGVVWLVLRAVLRLLLHL